MAVMKTLRLGSRGPQVELLQVALSRYGISLMADGIFGAATRNAVQAFQNDMGLAPDGIVGNATWSALEPYLTGYVVHTVSPGDTLFKIAVHHGTSVSSIEEANPGLDPKNLPVGAKLTVPLDFPVVPTSISFTSTVLEYCVRGLKARYPFLQLTTAGASVMGRPLYCFSMGEGGNSVFYNASHHANEWITTPLLMKFLEYYADAYSKGGLIFGEDARQLYFLTQLNIIPMVNPDGVDLVTGELDSGQYFNNAREISENYPGISFPSGWKANINGVDLNLQYPAGWDSAREIKFSQGFVSPAPRDFVGFAPLDQPESRAVYNYTLSNNFALTLSYHTQGQVIYWRFMDYRPENSYEIAQIFSRVSGYTVESTPYSSGFAGYKDWFIQNYNLPGYTIEAGSGKNPLSPTNFEQIMHNNSGILVTALKVTL